jgi:UPF0755 protein
MIESHKMISVQRTVRIIVVAFILILSIIGILGTLALAYNAPTDSFPVEQEVVIVEGSDVDIIAKSLRDADVIQSPILFRVLARHYGYDTKIQAGTYVFRTPLSTLELIETLGTHGPDKTERTITFPEGYSVKDFTVYTDTLFGSIDTQVLIPLEGSLFPDTYFVSNTESLDSLIEKMKEQHKAQLEPLRTRMQERGYSERDLIIFASILEREANDKTSMRMVAGILENRLKIDMPLQVDAVFAYYLGKTSAELTENDLRTDSPYNTYRNKGLPPAPIGNPGLMALEAVLNPTPSDYFYYLTGDDGNFYYAKTHEEHVRNKARYLR